MTETFSELSNNAVYSATIVFTLALFAHILEWAMARELPSAATRALGAHTDRRGELVGVGASGTAASSRQGSAADQRSSTAEAGPDGVDPDEVDPDEVERSDKFGRIGLSLTILAGLLLAGGVILRGLAAGRVPWGDMYEFIITCSLAITAAYVVLVIRYKVRWLGPMVTGFLALVLGVGVLVAYEPLTPLVPALHSYWLMIHVSSAAVAGGAFTVGALASVLFLVRRRMEIRAVQAGTAAEQRRGFLWRTPNSEVIDRVAYRVHAFAFPVWTFAVLCGAIWAQYAWGRFWGWDPKEVWAFITWVAYAAYLHARATAGWHGKAAAVVALVGFGTFLFNFVGINLFGSGLHTYAGM